MAGRLEEEMDPNMIHLCHLSINGCVGKVLVAVGDKRTGEQDSGGGRQKRRAHEHYRVWYGRER